MSFNSPFTPNNNRLDKPIQAVEPVLPVPHLSQPPQGNAPDNSGFSYNSVPSYGSNPDVEPTGKYSGISIAGFILAILLPIVGLILSIVAWKESAESGNKRGLAKAGIIVGSILTALNIIGIFVFFGYLQATTISGTMTGM